MRVPYWTACILAIFNPRTIPRFLGSVANFEANQLLEDEIEFEIQRSSNSQREIAGSEQLKTEI